MTVTLFGDMIAREQVALKIAEGFMKFATSPLTYLLWLTYYYYSGMTFIDALTFTILSFTYVNTGCTWSRRLVFFGVTAVLNMMIGILTPPMGMALFVVAQVGKMSVSTVTKGILPFLIPIAITLIIVTVFPQLITFLPNLIMGAV